MWFGRRRAARLVVGHLREIFWSISNFVSAPANFVGSGRVSVTSLNLLRNLVVASGDLVKPAKLATERTPAAGDGRQDYSDHLQVSKLVAEFRSLLQCKATPPAVVPG